MSEERLVPVRDVELCVEAFGDPAHPPVLMLGGAASSMDLWPPELCQALAAGGRYVVRYDHRDTGGSTSWPPGEPGYTGADLDRDAAALIEALGVGPAHLVGLSMGGGIAQCVALRRPDLVATLTLIATSPVGGVEGLPPPEPALQDRFAQPAPEPDWRDRDQVTDWHLGELRAFAGSLGIDEEQERASIGATFDRAADPASASNHWIVVGGDEDDAPLDTREIAAPTLVVHGTHDPLFPLPHGEALAAAIPDARLLVVDGLGHQVPPRPAWGDVVPAILEHTAG